MVCCRRDRIHLSTADRSDGSSPATGPADTPLMRANLVAFQSLLQKLRAPCTHSSLTATSDPGLEPRASANRGAAAPKRSIQSSGSTTLPKDFDIFLPYWSRTMPCSATTPNGG